MARVHDTQRSTTRPGTIRRPHQSSIRCRRVDDKEGLTFLLECRDSIGYRFTSDPWPRPGRQWRQPPRSIEALQLTIEMSVGTADEFASPRFDYSGPPCHWLFVSNRFA